MEKKTSNSYVKLLPGTMVVLGMILAYKYVGTVLAYKYVGTVLASLQESCQVAL